jgi:hypothetical protein
MRECPQCNRVYGLDITFCLYDGALLDDEQDSEKMVVKTASLPAPTQSAPTQAARVQPIARTAPPPVRIADSCASPEKEKASCPAYNSILRRGRGSYHYRDGDCQRTKHAD